ncbi:MAG: hypothetical protein H0Z25_05575 [Kosmotoga sp.]|uniref:DUF6544 family protein n=1 Tax=Kosmotoga sp. TaxID=1955248 RepID=UPI001D216845|nr:DUF6544 family protein [Kosmotoga sp.]MBO8166668.1 hypothetical protein [Kosmotoga sp.]
MRKVIFITFGVLAIIIIIAIAAIFIANMKFNQKVAKEVKELFAGISGSDDSVIQRSNLEKLPIPVKKWLEFSNIVGKEKVTSVRLKQKAVMRLKEAQSWMPVEAEQYFTVNEPGFIWKARIKAAPLFHIVGRDKYFEGKGSMLIKALSLIKIADSSGKEINQGTLIRYLAETVWFPSAALNSYITWEEIDASSARATIDYRGITVSGVFNFNNIGEVTSFVAKRYMENNGKYSLETWLVTMRNYKELDGIKIPTEGKVVWKLETGDFTWFKFEITEIEYNLPVVY